jgi:hypothetical protein
MTLTNLADPQLLGLNDKKKATSVVRRIPSVKRLFFHAAADAAGAKRAIVLWTKEHCSADGQSRTQP